MSKAQRMTSTADVLEHHITAFGEQDLPEMMADYTEDSVIISNIGTFRGLGEIQSMAEQLFEEFSQDGVEFTLDHQTVEGAVGYTVWQAETPDNDYKFGTDTLVVRDGIIESQTFAVDVTPKN